MRITTVYHPQFLITAKAATHFAIQAPQYSSTKSKQGNREAQQKLQ
jgi:hypothetical protein